MPYQVKSVILQKKKYTRNILKSNFGSYKIKYVGHDEANKLHVLTILRDSKCSLTLFFTVA